jgi:hypothetical protein
MGPTKLSTIRERVRRSFNMSDAELQAWLNQQMEDRKRKTDAQTELETLRLLRDALKKETRDTPKKKTHRKSIVKR